MHFGACKGNAEASFVDTQKPTYDELLALVKEAHQILRLMHNDDEAQEWVTHWQRMQLEAK